MQIRGLITMPAQAHDVPIDVQIVGNRRLQVGETLELLLLARQPFGQVPWLFAEYQPRGSTLTDNDGATRMFCRTPQIQDIGESTLRLVSVENANHPVRVDEYVYMTVLLANPFISRLATIAPADVSKRLTHTLPVIVAHGRQSMVGRSLAAGPQRLARVGEKAGHSCLAPESYRRKTAGFRVPIPSESPVS